MHTGFWWSDLREGHQLEEPGVVVRIILKWVFKECYREAWIGFMWLRIGTGGGPL